MPDLHDLAPTVDADSAWHIFTRVARQRHARRRRAAALTIVAVVVAGIAVTYLGTQSSGRRVEIETSPTVPRSTTRSPTCAPSQLTATFGFVNNSSGALGGVVLTNHAASACSLHGRPDVRVLTRGGRYLSVRPDSGPAGNTPPTPSNQPVVLTARARQPQAGVMLLWRNWCANAPGPVVVSLQFGDWNSNLVAAPAANADPSTVPPCVNRSQPTTITVGNIQAHDAGGFR